METLPVEMVERIVRQLTPQDLARCSAVCREWREIFNQDWVWKPHCDPELEEPLRTIPCVATPAFVAPEAENSTLSPISCWKLAFLRENHLWKNWRSKEMMDKNDNVTKFGNNCILDVDFLTDTAVVFLYSNRFSILDVSGVPTSLVAETDNSGAFYCHLVVIGPTMLVLVTIDSIQLFNVCIFNKTIELKHTISFQSTLSPRDFFESMLRPSSSFIVAPVQSFLCVNERSKLKIIALNTGKLLREEPCPEKITQNGKVSFADVKISPTSDFAACLVVVQNNSSGKEYYKYYIYNLKKLAFLPGPVAEYDKPHNGFTLQGHWLAVTDHKTLQVYNFQTRDVLLSYARSNHAIYFPSQELLKVEAFRNCFLFLDVNCESGESYLKVYIPSRRSLTTKCELSYVEMIRVINNKFIEVSHVLNRVSVWKLSGQAVEKSDITVMFGYVTNRSFTKAFYKDYLNGTFEIHYLW